MRKLFFSLHFNGHFSDVSGLDGNISNHVWKIKLTVQPSLIMKANDNTILLSANVKFEPMVTFIVSNSGFDWS